MKKSNRLYYTLALGVLCSSLLSGCLQSDQDLVKAQAQERWNALIQGDLETAYDFYSESYKKTKPFNIFKNKVRGVGLWKEAEIMDVSCEQQISCEVSAKISVSLRMRGLAKPAEVSDTVKEVWIYEGWLKGWSYVEKHER